MKTPDLMTTKFLETYLKIRRHHIKWLLPDKSIGPILTLTYNRYYFFQVSQNKVFFTIAVAAHYILVLSQKQQRTALHST